MGEGLIHYPQQIYQRNVITTGDLSLKYQKLTITICIRVLQLLGSLKENNVIYKTKYNSLDISINKSNTIYPSL